MKALTTAAGPLEKSYLNARKIDNGGMTAPTSTAVRKTCQTLRETNIPMDDGIIR